MHIRENDWVKYRHHEGWCVEGKVLEKRPDDMLVVGSHDKDPNPDIISEDKIVEKI